MKKNTKKKSIPKEKEISWDTIYSMPIIDCGEEVVPLSLTPENMLVRSAYFEAGIAGALPECYARIGVLHRLKKAIKLLPKHMRFVVLDAWRSQQVQKTLFQRCKAVLAKVNPDLDKEKLHIMTQQYVAIPSANLSAPSPHSTAGAIDLMIATRDGSALFFGSPFDYPSEISYTRYFERQIEYGNILDKEEKEATKNRRLLYDIMTEVGFVNYSCEWWHYEYGTQRWANEKNKTHAIYGSTSVRLNSFEALQKT